MDDEERENSLTTQFNQFYEDFFLLKRELPMLKHQHPGRFATAYKGEILVRDTQAECIAALGENCCWAPVRYLGEKEGTAPY